MRNLNVKIGQKGVKTKYSNYALGFIDIGKINNTCYLEMPSGRFINFSNIEHNKSSYEDFYDQVLDFTKSEKNEGILIGIESTGTYGDPMKSWLAEKEVVVVGVNPKHMSRMKELVGNSPKKSDGKDPLVGTLIIQNGSFYKFIETRGVAADLKNLSRHRKQLKIQENRFLNHLESILAKIFPEYLQIMKTLTRVSSVLVLRDYPLPKDLLELNKERLGSILKKQSFGNIGESRAVELLESARKTIGLKQGLESSGIAIRNLAEQVALIRKQIKEIEKEMAIRLEQHEEAQFLKSVPGMGLISMCEIIGETGGLKYFTNGEQLVKLAGLNMYNIQSGKYAGYNRITKRGKSVLRQNLYLMALRTVKKSGIYHEEYQEYIKRMKKPKALIAISKKLIRMIFSLVKNEELFCNEKFERRHQHKKAS